MLNIKDFKNINEFYNYLKKNKISNKTKLVSDNEDYTNLFRFMVYYKKELLKLQRELYKYNETLHSNDNKIVESAINKLIYMNADGKFLRGCLIELGYKHKYDDDYAKNLSVAYETFETSILIHDDIIDNSLLRRGKETIPTLYNKELNNKDNTHNALGICIGDLGFYFTNDLIIKKYKNHKRFIELFNYYNNIVINTIKGEIIDIYLPYKEKHDRNNILNEKDIMEIYRLKTSWYSIVGPFCLGMLLGNSSKKDISLMERILEPLGIAFQIKDDILGIFSSKEVLGKPVYSDIEEFKQTILYSYIKINKKDYYDKLLKYYGKQNITEKESKYIQNIIIESGSLEYAQNKMNELFNEAKSNIESLNIKKDIKDILLGIIVYLNIREK